MFFIWRIVGVTQVHFSWLSWSDWVLFQRTHWELSIYWETKCYDRKNKVVDESCRKGRLEIVSEKQDFNWERESQFSNKYFASGLSPAPVGLTSRALWIQNQKSFFKSLQILIGLLILVAVREHCFSLTNLLHFRGCRIYFMDRKTTTKKPDKSTRDFWGCKTRAAAYEFILTLSQIYFIN